MSIGIKGCFSFTTVMCKYKRNGEFNDLKLFSTLVAGFLSVWNMECLNFLKRSYLKGTIMILYSQR
jgi:hypothetical protein